MLEPRWNFGTFFVTSTKLALWFGFKLSFDDCKHGDSHLPTGYELFEIARVKLPKAIAKAVEVSESRMGTVHTGRQNRVLLVFAKTVAHSMSIHLICKNAPLPRTDTGLLDHFSIAALTRCVIDSAIMTLYQSEPSLSLSQWELRRHVLILHDMSNRKRFLTLLHKIGPPDEEPLFLANYAKDKVNFQAEVTKYCADLAVPEEDKLKYLDGQTVFVNGIRGAVREAKLDIEMYEFLHVYLSNYVHSHPVSLSRAKEHNISFEEPSEFQSALCATCLDAVCDYLEAAITRIETFTGSDDKDPLGQL